MPAKKLSIPVTPEMAKALDELCELHALQLPSLASMLLRDALAGRRSALLPKRPAAKPQQDPDNSLGVLADATGAQNGAGAVQDSPSEETSPGSSWSLLGGRPDASPSAREA